MAAYQTFTSTRTTRPDALGLLAALRTSVAPEVGITFADDQQHYTLKKATAWQPADIAAAQSTLDTFAASTPQLSAQHEIDNWPITIKALALVMTDRTNLLGEKLSPPLQDVTPAQVQAAVRAKAGTL